MVRTMCMRTQVEGHPEPAASDFHTDEEHGAPFRCVLYLRCGGAALVTGVSLLLLPSHEKRCLAKAMFVLAGLLGGTRLQACEHAAD
jgi:hypothetical protein